MRPEGVLPATVGLAVLAFAVRASPVFLQQRVFQPGYFMPPGAFAAWAVRAVALAVAALLLVAALRVRSLGAVARGSLAVLLAAFAVEIGLRLRGQPLNPIAPLEARMGRSDPRLAWTIVPSRTTEYQALRSGKRVRYAADAHGDRAAAQEFVEDPAAPTLLLTGESIAFGHSLDWSESLPGALQRELRLQIVDVAVGGYGSDQAFLRLRDALPRFHNLVATVTVVVPVQLGRNLQSYRPRLGLENGALVPRPAETYALKLGSIFANELPLLTEPGFEESVQLTRAILLATAQLGPAIFVLIDLGEPPGSTDWLLERLFKELREVRVELRHDQLLADGHPGAQATAQIARAVADELLRK
jgi:hypothetical protein